MTTRCLLVGITGGSGSGKTALAGALAGRMARLRPIVLDQDRYYRDLSAMPAAARHVVNFDEPGALDLDLFAAHLAALREGRAIAAPEYCFETHCRAPRTTAVGPSPVVIVEGLLLAHEPRLRALFDLTAFVDAPADVRLARRILRDTAARGRTPESVVRQYLTSVRVMHERWVEPQRDRCDVVVPNEGPLEEAADAVARALRARSPLAVADLLERVGG